MCDYFKVSRSCHYKQLNSDSQKAFEDSMVVDLVQEKRGLVPRIGGKKLYFLLGKDLQEFGKIGRDKFFSVLKKNGLLVERKRSYTRTTDSYHHFHCWSNLIKERKFNGGNQCWVSDITYLRTRGGFVYLFLITDLYSRKVVGWSLSNSLSIEGGLEALKMSLRQRTDKSIPLIQHSDRGVQYCSKSYVGILQKHGIFISMTQEHHCYENATAERVNGILKDEFFLDDTFKSQAEATRAVKEAIQIYNNHRPHWSLSLQTPSQVHQETA